MNQNTALIPECPVTRHMAGVEDHSHGLALSMRLLRQSLLACDRCPARQGCLVLQDYDRMMAAALYEARLELGLIER